MFNLRTIKAGGGCASIYYLRYAFWESILQSFRASGCC